jgi:hypothetical protein
MIKSLDQYSVKARLYPSFIVISPLIILISFSFYEYLKVIQILLGFITTFGFTFLFSQLARDRGKKLEIILFKKWGGKPTNIYLRADEKYLDGLTRDRYAKKLELLIDGLKMPTTEFENKNPDESEKIYDTVTKYLISQTRDYDKYTVLFLENISYGFRRNLLGMKPFAILILVMCLSIQILQHIKIDNLEHSIFLTSEVLIPLSIYFLLMLFWIFIVKESWLKAVAFEYAKRLFETLELNL